LLAFADIETCPEPPLQGLLTIVVPDGTSFTGFRPTTNSPLRFAKHAPEVRVMTLEPVLTVPVIGVVMQLT
jgi:hypothetical protein